MGTRLVLRYYICVIYTIFPFVLLVLRFLSKTLSHVMLILYQPATAKHPVCADGLRKVLKYIKENYNDPEIIVTGNGMPLSFALCLEPGLKFPYREVKFIAFSGYKETLEEKDVLPDALSDSNRKYYHMRHLMALHGAVWCVNFITVSK